MSANRAALLAIYGDKKKKVKKKDGQAKANSGLRIIDEDVDWKQTVKVKNEEDEEDGPVIANLEEFQMQERIIEEEKEKRKKMQAWQNVKDEDESPPRKRRRYSPDNSPPRRRRHDSQSPERNVKTEDLSPPRRRHDSPDQSPPRRKRHDSPDQSPPRRKRHDSPDQSPSRRKRHDSPDQSPPRRKKHDSPDQSPPRRKRHDSPDLSPPRRKRRDSPIQAKKSVKDEDLSPPRKRRHDSPSPPRRERRSGGRDLSPPRRKRHDSSSPPRRKDEREKTDSGFVTGLQTAEQIRAAAAAMKEKAKDTVIDDELTGRNAKTVYRRGGKRYDPEEEAAAKKKEEKEAKAPTEQQMEWGRGLVKKQEVLNERDEMIQSLQSKFARTEDDDTLDKSLRDLQHWDDPMRKHLGQEEDDFDIMKKMDKKERKKRDKAYIENEVNKRMSYKGSFQPNRFGIRPGKRWDGVDRSNGFEKEMFMARHKAAEKKKDTFAAEVAGL